MATRRQIALLRWSISLALVVLIGGAALTISVALLQWLPLVDHEAHDSSVVFRFHAWTRAVVAGVALSTLVLAWRLWPWLWRQALLLPAFGLGVLAACGPALLWDRVDLDRDGFSLAEHQWFWLGPSTHAQRYRFAELDWIGWAPPSAQARPADHRHPRGLAARLKSQQLVRWAPRLVLEAAAPRLFDAARAAGVSTSRPAGSADHLAHREWQP